MKRLFLIGLVITLTSSLAMSQGGPGRGKSSLGVGAELSVPTGDFSDLAGTGYGGFARYQYGMDARSTFMLTLGYTTWAEKDLGTGAKIQPEAFRISGGTKYFFAKGFYGLLEIGTDVYTFTRTGTVLGVEGSTWRFMLPLGLGYEMGGFDVGAKYYIFDLNYSSFSVALGYNFTL